MEGRVKKKKWAHHIQEPVKATALCLGAFDGVHLGHKALIKTTIEKSHAQGTGASAQGASAGAGAGVGASTGTRTGASASVQGTGAFGLSFSPHPREFFHAKDPAHHAPFERIYPEEINAELMRLEGLEDLYFVCFDEKLSIKSTDDFLDYVKNYIDFSCLVVGFDFRLGSQRKGGQEELEAWCSKNEIEFIAISKVEVEVEVEVNNRSR